MKKLLCILILIITAFVITMPLIPAGIEITKNIQNQAYVQEAESNLDIPTYPTIAMLHIKELKNPTFRFGGNSPGTYERTSDGHIHIEGLFFNVEIRGEVVGDTELYLNLNLFYSQEMLHIYPGDTVEINARVLVTDWGAIYQRENYLAINALTIGLNIKEIR